MTKPKPPSSWEVAGYTAFGFAIQTLGGAVAPRLALARTRRTAKGWAVAIPANALCIYAFRWVLMPRFAALGERSRAIRDELAAELGREPTHEELMEAHRAAREP